MSKASQTTKTTRISINKLSKVECLISILQIKTFRRYFSICVIGSVGAILQLFIYNLLRHKIMPEYANMIGVESAILSNFFLNNKITFAERKLSRHHKLRLWLKKLFQFNLFSFGSMLIQIVILLLGLDVFGHGFWVENSFVLLGIFFGSVYGYLMYSRIIWGVGWG